MIPKDFIILIPLLPLLGFLINGSITYEQLRGRVCANKSMVSFVACLMPFLSFALGLWVLLTLALHPEIKSISTPHLLDWMILDHFHLTFGLEIDHLSSVMTLVVTGVGFLIHLYSVGYMHDDPHYSKYMSYLNLFLFFMLVLVVADSLVLLFVGWEGVGLCSYLLIGFWFTDKEKAKAGKKAFIVNRIGDFGFMIGIFLIVAAFAAAVPPDTGTEIARDFLSFSYLKTHAGVLTPIITAVTLCLFFGATGKSAQIPLYVWLPDAMAGPTPVSALIHAATMVTAGIYMVARLHFLFVMAPFTMHVVATVGLVTALLAAIIGLTQYDIKKVLAYSTVSQLGYMFLGLGVGAFSGAIFHVMTHAFFKACLFLGAGSVIHALHHEQDIRFMGGLVKKMPITAVTFLVCTLAIAGIPPLAGFFSKDEILFMTYANEHTRHYFWVGLFTAGVTAFYMMRLFVYAFTGKTRYEHPEKIHESPWTMTLPLIILAGLATVAGFLGMPGHSIIGGWLSHLGQITPHHIEGSALQEFHLMGISVGWAGFCALAAFFLYKRNLNFTEGLKRTFKTLYSFIYNKYKVDEIYDFLFVQPIKGFSQVFLNRFFDQKIVDGLMVNGLALSSRFLGRCLSLIQTGLAVHYLLFLLIGLCLVIWFIVNG
ncbi:MAG: NADH-quinone oxidoreductase subunit L [Deltaproteobacteria bacterium]|nr:NADH-quinone oxidoreductase subunit L [Deltaproteobacteria bacterium]